MDLEKKRPGRPMSVSSPWQELYQSMGGQQKLADHLGVSKSTIGKWACDVHRIPALAKKELLRLCQDYKIRDGLDKF